MTHGSRSRRPLSLVVGLSAALWASGCAFPPSPRTTPTPEIVGEPLPGYVRIVADPPQATSPVTVRFHAVGVGGASTVYFEFDTGDPILIVFPSTPGNSALQVNDIICDGQWSIRSTVETDVWLHLDDGACSVEVIGSHPFGRVHTDPQTEPKIDGH